MSLCLTFACSCMEGATGAELASMRQALRCLHELLVLAGNLAHLLPPHQLISAMKQVSDQPSN